MPARAAVQPMSGYLPVLTRQQCFSSVAKAIEEGAGPGHPVATTWRESPTSPWVTWHGTVLQFVPRREEIDGAFREVTLALVHYTRGDGIEEGDSPTLTTFPPEDDVEVAEAFFPRQLFNLNAPLRPPPTMAPSIPVPAAADPTLVVVPPPSQPLPLNLAPLRPVPTQEQRYERCKSTMQFKRTLELERVAALEERLNRLEARCQRTESDLQSLSRSVSPVQRFPPPPPVNAPRSTGTIEDDEYFESQCAGLVLACPGCTSFSCIAVSKDKSKRPALHRLCILHITTRVLKPTLNLTKRVPNPASGRLEL